MKIRSIHHNGQTYEFGEASGGQGIPGPQGPKGDTVILGTEEEYTLYNTSGPATDGAMTQLASGEAVGLFVDINLNNYSSSKCSLGASSWYYSNNQAHKAIPVAEGDHIFLCNTTTGADAYYGWLTSAYTGNYKNGNAIPYAAGTARIAIPEGESVWVTPPAGAAWLILNVYDGAGAKSFAVRKSRDAGDRLVWQSDFEQWLSDYNNARQSLHKLRVVSWNMGMFSHGSTFESTITPAESAEKDSAYRQLVHQMDADLLCLCEYTPVFVKAADDNPAIRSSESVFSLYPNAYEGSRFTTSSRMQTALYGRFPLSAVGQTEYVHWVQRRYYQHGTFMLGGHKVNVIITHLDWHQGEHGNEYRAEQIQHLITTYADEPYVILCGDWNVDALSEYDAFTQAGYQLVNHGYLGNLETYDGDNGDFLKYIDNIIVKGFAVSDIQTYDGAYELSDHHPIAATLTLLSTP